jgi:hypothetical protein
MERVYADADPTTTGENLIDVCDHDGDGPPTRLPLKVCHLAAGFYIGLWCPQCGPFARWSEEYWRTHGEAALALASGAYTLRLDP